MVLSDRTIKRLLAEGRIGIDPYDEALLQPSSVDVRVDRYFRVFHNARYPYIDVKEPQEDLTELVEVGPGGTVQTAAWVTAPHDKHPLDEPFAWALITLDGADTPMLHAVAASGPDAVGPGTRVVPRWADEREGHITDIAHFEIEGSA